MYCLTDAQVDYILNDIRRNGVEMEDLQLNLLDHICCIVERQLKEDDDFERFYQETIRQFYKKELREIEVETINLLTFKNYYGMKKLMIVSGAFSAVAFILGSIFKAMHWPGAAVLLVLAIVTLAFIFLPLMVMLKTREGGTMRDKLVMALGALTGMLFALSTLFAVMHWPGGTPLWISTVSISAFLLIPVYFFTGIRKPEAKLNTIITTVLLVALTGITFTMIRLRKSKQTSMYTYAMNEQLLRNMQRTKMNADPLVADINAVSEQIKAIILQGDIGMNALPVNMDAGMYSIQENSLSSYNNNMRLPALIATLKDKVTTYNNTLADTQSKVPLDDILLNTSYDELRMFTNFYVLNNVTQLQMYVANTENNKLALSKN